jgi:hypothetical protein
MRISKDNFRSPLEFGKLFSSLLAHKRVVNAVSASLALLAPYPKYIYYAMQCVELVPNGSENVTKLFQLPKKVTILFQIANKSDELIPNGSVEPVPIDKVVDFIPYRTHSNLFQMDVSDLFSPPGSL